MQQDILSYFRSWESPFLDHLAEGITMLGEPGVYILVIAVFYWAVSKKTGMTLTFALLLSVFSNALLKIVFRAPRPFEVIPEIQGKRLETATGYSFPSGHTQGASSFYTAVITLFKNKVLKILCVLIIFLVGVSRIYLGVHWPVDVLAGWLIGIALAVYLSNMIRRRWDDKEALGRLVFIMLLLTCLTSAVMIILEIFLFRGELKTVDFFKNAGLILGSFSGFLLEMSAFNFDADRGTLSQKIIRVIAGTAGVVLLQGGLKIIFPDYFLFHMFRYGLMGFWMTFLFPLLGKKARLFI